MGEPSRALRVAVVQLACEVNDFAGNTSKAETFIERAAADGAQLVLLPELVPSGYILTEAIWEGAEPFDGRTLRWLRGLSQRLNVMLATTFLEADGEDFYNTFVLVDGAGEVFGKVRKNPPASFEAWFFRAGETSHWFDTPFGRFGVGICFENALYDHYFALRKADVDLVLRPFSGASFEAKWPVRPEDVEQVNIALRDGTAEAATLMGVPVLMANKVGTLVTPLPTGGRPKTVEFPGYTAVADGDGRLLGQLGPGQEGIVVGDITIDARRKSPNVAPRRYGKWTAKLPWWAFLWDVTGWLGARAYARNPQRKAAASTASRR